MASKNQFTYTKTTLENIGRSVFDLSHRVTYDCQHGSIVPVGVYEVIPGDVFSWKVNTFVRTATQPIAPIMSNIYASIAAFFVPKRLLYSQVKKFYGEKVDGYGIQIEVTEPVMTPGLVGGSTFFVDPADIGAEDTFAKHFGFINVNDEGVADSAFINVLPIRAYLQVVNDWFLNENFSPKYLWDHDADYAESFALYKGDNVRANYALPKCLKKLDRFTSCLPWAQKAANPVSIGLTGLAPVGSQSLNPEISGVTDVLLLHKKEGVADVSLMDDEALLPEDSGIPGNIFESNLLDGNGETVRTNLFADLSKAAAITINQLRMSVALQRYYEALARGGSKYREVLLSMFGVRVSDTTAQMAEYLGGISFMLNIAQVLQTAGYEAGSSTKLAAPGAVSCTRQDDYLFNKGFEEPGYIVVVQYTKHQRTYGTGLDDMFLKKEIWDYYNPKFAHVGEVPIKKVLISSDLSAFDEYFGFQEYGSEYRSYPDKVRGLLNPTISSSLDFWTLSENFNSAQVLDLDFLTEDRSAIARCLAGGTDSPDYFFDIYNVVKATRSMPVHSIPGLMDHF